MHKTKQAKTSRMNPMKTNLDKEDDTELNNVKITDFQSKEMLLLTSQIFDIRSDAMLESKTSGLYRNPEINNKQATLVSDTSRNSKLNSQSVPSEIHAASYGSSK